VHDVSALDDQHIAPGHADRNLESRVVEMSSRQVPLVVVGCASAAMANSAAAQLRRQGNVVYVTHSADGCLRVAVSVEPDMILLDSAFPGRVEKLLKAHPASAHAQVFHLPDDLSRVSEQPARTVKTAGPHAA
jgi:hypothetical protein